MAQKEEDGGAVFFLLLGLGVKDPVSNPQMASTAISAPHFWKMSSGKNADTVTLGKSTALLILRSTATLQMI